MADKLSDKVADQINSAIDKFKREVMSVMTAKDNPLPQGSRKPSGAAVQQKMDDLYQPYKIPRFGESSSSKQSPFRATKRQSKVIDTPIFRNVILLKSADADSIVRKAERDEYSVLGLLQPGLEFNKNQTEHQTNEVIEKAFKTFPEIANFSWMYECGSTKLIPISSMDGIKLSQLYNQKKFIYIRPSVTLKLPYPNKRRRLSSSEEMPAADEMPTPDEMPPLVQMPAPDEERGFDDDDMKEALARSLIDYRKVETDNMTLNYGVEIVTPPSTIVKPTPSSAKDVLMVIAENMPNGIRLLIIVRQDVLGSAFQGMSKSTFDPDRKINIIFADDVEGNFREEGVDTGGLKREFFSLALRSIENYHVFVGQPKYLCYDADALRENKYYMLGVILGKTLLEGGPSPAFFHKNFFEFLLENLPAIEMDEECLPKTIGEEVKKIQAADTLSALNDSISDQTLASVGITYPLSLDRKETLISDIMHYYLINCLHGPMKQLRDGLKVNGLYEQIVAHQNFFRSAFVANDSMRFVTAGTLRDMFCVVRSEKGSTNFALESKAYAFWLSFLDDCGDGLLEETPEGNAIIDRKKEMKFDGTVTPLQPLTDEEVASRGWKKVTCSEILQFATGAFSIPILGFQNPPTMEFLLGPVKSKNLMPEAHTCSPTLYLPVGNKCYDLFATRFIYAMHFGQKFHKI